LSDPAGGLFFESASENFEDLFENAPCGYLVLSPDGRITSVNRTLCSWTGYSQSHFVGKRVHQFLNMAAASTMKRTSRRCCECRASSTSSPSIF
jgi:PAS domain S-box-containing protein